MVRLLKLLVAKRRCEVRGFWRLQMRGGVVLALEGNHQSQAAVGDGIAVRLMISASKDTEESIESG